MDNAWGWPLPRDGHNTRLLGLSGYLLSAGRHPDPGVGLLVVASVGLDAGSLVISSWDTILLLNLSFGLVSGISSLVNVKAILKLASNSRWLVVCGAG